MVQGCVVVYKAQGALLRQSSLTHLQAQAVL
jgi:hypothetical protein